MTKAEQIARLRKATGLGWLFARVFLAQSRELAERIIAADEQQQDRRLHDPIEDDPVFAERISTAKKKAEEALREHVAERNADYVKRGLSHMVSENPRGSCHFLWRETKGILAEQHGITWFSPGEMNPGTKFD